MTAHSYFTVTLSWDYDGPDAAGFRFYVNGNRVSRGTSGSQRSTRFWLLPGQTATFQVEAYNSSSSAQAELTVQQESISQPLAGLLPGNTARVGAAVPSRSVRR